MRIVLYISPMTRGSMRFTMMPLNLGSRGSWSNNYQRVVGPHAPSTPNSWKARPGMDLMVNKWALLGSSRDL